MEDVSLKELMETRFQALERRIDELTRAIERLAEGTVSAERFESAYHKVSKLEQAVADLDNRLGKAEGYIGAWRYIGATVITIVTALAIAWLSSHLV